MNKICFILAPALFSQILFSQDLITDRPDQTESAVVVGEKKIQIESGILNQENSGGEKNLSIPTNLFRYGISEKIELRLNLEHSDKKNYGIESIEIGSKINLNKNKNTLNQKIATVRAGNVIGGGDYSEDRLIPDIYRFAKKKRKSWHNEFDLNLS